MNTNRLLQPHIEAVLDAIREPLELDRWTLKPEAGALEEGRGACSAMPEYREAALVFDLDRFQTGDDVAEMVVHEVTHCHTWPIHAVAEHLAHALADVLPEPTRDGMRKLLQEWVREEAERTTTDVAYTYLRLLRRAGVLPTPNPGTEDPGMI